MVHIEKQELQFYFPPFVILFLLKPTIQILIISPLTFNTISKHKEIFTWYPKLF
jgi:hypothetical protein